MLSELRAYSEYSKKHFDINYWGTPSENEVDFVCTKGKRRIGIEVKLAKKWKPDFAKGLRVLLDAKKIQKAYVVSDGAHNEQHDDILFLSFADFCIKLHEGEII